MLFRSQVDIEDDELLPILVSLHEKGQLANDSLTLKDIPALNNTLHENNIEVVSMSQDPVPVLTTPPPPRTPTPPPASPRTPSPTPLPPSQGAGGGGSGLLGRVAPGVDTGNILPSGQKRVRFNLVKKIHVFVP